MTGALDNPDNLDPILPAGFSEPATVQTFILFVAFLLLVPGCAPTASLPDQVPAASVEGQEWVLAAFDAGEPAPHEPEITARISEERIWGTSACNEYFADLKSLAPGRVEVGPVGATRMLCPAEVMDIEHRYLELLGAVRAYRLHDGRLVLEWATVDGKQGELIFDRRARDSEQGPRS